MTSKKRQTKGQARARQARLMRQAEAPIEPRYDADPHVAAAALDGREEEPEPTLEQFRAKLPPVDSELKICPRGGCRCRS